METPRWSPAFWKVCVLSCDGHSWGHSTLWQLQYAFLSDQENGNAQHIAWSRLDTLTCHDGRPQLEGIQNGRDSWNLRPLTGWVDGSLPSLDKHPAQDPWRSAEDFRNKNFTGCHVGLQAHRNQRPTTSAGWRGGFIEDFAESLEDCTQNHPQIVALPEAENCKEPSWSWKTARVRNEILTDSHTYHQISSILKESLAHLHQPGDDSWQQLSAILPTGPTLELWPLLQQLPLQLHWWPLPSVLTGPDVPLSDQDLLAQRPRLLATLANPLLHSLPQPLPEIQQLKVPKVPKAWYPKHKGSLALPPAPQHCRDAVALLLWWPESIQMY